MYIKTSSIAGFKPAFDSIRLPYREKYRTLNEFEDWVKDNRSTDGTLLVDLGETTYLDYNDIDLAQRLILSGDEHAKPMRGIIVWADILMPIYWWSEAETYTAGHQRVFSASTQNNEGKQLKGKALQKAKREISYGREIRKIDFFSYQALRNIVRQRHNHRLPEWHLFIEWIKTLPLASDLILVGLEKELEIHDALYKEFKEEGCYE